MPASETRDSPAGGQAPAGEPGAHWRSRPRVRRQRTTLQRSQPSGTCAPPSRASERAAVANPLVAERTSSAPTRNSFLRDDASAPGVRASRSITRLRNARRPRRVRRRRPVSDAYSRCASREPLPPCHRRERRSRARWCKDRAPPAFARRAAFGDRPDHDVTVGHGAAQLAALSVGTMPVSESRLISTTSGSEASGATVSGSRVMISPAVRAIGSPARVGRLADAPSPGPARHTAGLLWDGATEVVRAGLQEVVRARCGVGRVARGQRQHTVPVLACRRAGHQQAVIDGRADP